MAYADVDSIQNLEKYLRRTVRNHIFQYLKIRKHEVLTDVEDKPDQEGLEKNVAREAEKVDPVEVLSQSPVLNIWSPCQRVAILLRLGFGIAPRNISKIMGNSTNVISSSITQGLGKLRNFQNDERFRRKIQKRMEKHPTKEQYRAEVFINERMPTELNRWMGSDVKGDIIFLESRFLLPIGNPLILEKMYYIITFLDPNTPPDLQTLFHRSINSFLFELNIENDEFYLNKPRQILISDKPFPPPSETIGNSPEAISHGTWQFEQHIHNTGMTTPTFMTTGWGGLNIPYIFGMKEG